MITLKNSREQGTSMELVLVIFALVVVVGGITYFASVGELETENVSETDNGTGEDTSDDGEGSMFSGEVLAGDVSPLINYNKVDYEKAIASDKLVVIYFYANWCPVCKPEVANALYPAFNELKDENVVGFRVNYKDPDTDADEVELAKEFNITYQHTKVFVKNGERILKAPDTWTKERYLTEIANASS